MNEGLTVRQELLFAIRSEQFSEQHVHVILDVVEEVLRQNRALLRGESINLPYVIPGSCMARALYASIPVLFPEGLATLKSTSPPTVFVWLFPLLPEEKALIESCGWDTIEDRLEAANPDLFDVCRESMA